MVTPDSAVTIVLRPVVQPSVSPSPLFEPGCESPLELSQGAVWVLRLPYPSLTSTWSNRGEGSVAILTPGTYFCTVLDINIIFITMCFCQLMNCCYSHLTFISVSFCSLYNHLTCFCQLMYCYCNHLTFVCQFLYCCYSHLTFVSVSF